jgi:two-component system KDP operon response regulator KdpE
LRTILIVDDDSGWRRTVGDALRAKGHRVIEASDGLEALEHLARRPDLVLLDLCMPWVDGVQLLNEIRKASVPGCPVIVVSSDSSPETRTMLADFGVDTVVSKEGLTPAALGERVEEEVAGLTTSR